MIRPRKAAVSCVLCASILVATGSGGAASALALAHQSRSAPIVITEEDAYAYPASAVMNELIARFDKQNPGYVVHRTLTAYTGMYEKLLHQASSHTLDDVVMVDEGWLAELAAGGVLVPLSKFGFTGSDLNNGARAVGTVNGVLWGASVANNSLGLIYNKKMLAAAHVSPPKTWAQLLAAAKATTRNGVYGFAFGGGQNAPADWQFEPFFFTAGGSVSQVNNAGGVKALTFLSELVKDGYASRSVATWSQEDSAEQFIEGKAAMADDGPWEIPAFQSQKGLSWGAEPMPTPTLGMTSISPVGGPLWSVAQGSPAQEKLAWKFISFLLQPANISTFALNQDEVPSLKSLDATLAKTDPLINLFAQSTEDGVSRTYADGPRRARLIPPSPKR